MYMAPELFDRGKEYWGCPCDIWACGVVLYAISTGHFPFAAMTERDIITKIKRGIYHIPQGYPDELNVILRKMLNIDPARRATAAEILTHLEDVELPGNDAKDEGQNVQDASFEPADISPGMFDAVNTPTKQGKVGKISLGETVVVDNMQTVTSDERTLMQTAKG